MGKSEGATYRNQPIFFKTLPPIPYRTEQIKLNRVRPGHTSLTHDYLFSNEEPPKHNIFQTRLRIKHILIECPQHKKQKEDSKLDITLEKILVHNTDIQ
ncbi:hypothetical protein WA026_009774 [Henosepilachna vigintioctopunctata]|uniref:Uncharacterized protein n=1 Tax=Henosepilachna vigintioctopunctata TaxID=420089 RepID=A0AAW1TQX5_9CUCU